MNFHSDFKQFHTIAILGGTFNPVHVGHIEMAKQVLVQYSDVEHLFVMPNHLPAYKDKTELVAASDRLTMLSLAFLDIAGVSVSDFEIVQDGYTYTVNTLRQILNLNQNLKIYFVIGDDSLFSFRKWYQYKEILKLCEILVIARGESELTVKKFIEDFVEELPYARFSIVKMPKIQVSSSEIRNRCHTGKDIKGLVPELVQLYMEKHGLYKFAEGSVDG